MQTSQVGGQRRREDGAQDERGASGMNQAWSWTLNMIYCKCLCSVSEIHHLEHNIVLALDFMLCRISVNLDFHINWRKYFSWFYILGCSLLLRGD